ncbi:hypothetical protein AB0O47_06245 [Streptomyces noursei]|uniref:hypothetical protein n=1 Tax=Streptomyces noursei TaxID=1971 RepID=UPI00344EA076
MNPQRIAAIALLTAAALGSTGTAHATTIIGFGNATAFNSCGNFGGGVHGHTAKVARESGLLNGDGIALPVSQLFNQCGDLGGYGYTDAHGIF